MHARTLLLAAASTALAAAPARAQEITLRLTAPVGQVTHYRTVNQTWMQFPGMPVGDTTLPATQQTIYTTRTVTGLDGTARVVTTVVDSSKMEAPGMPAMAGMMGGGRDMLRGMSTTQKIDPLGRVLSTDITPPPGIPAQFAQNIARGSGRNSPVMPEGAIKPGDTWTDTMATAAPEGRGMPAETKIRIAMRFDRVERQGGARFAVISMNGTIQSDTAGAAGEGLINGTMTGEVAVELEAGRIARSTSDLHAVAQSPRGTMPLRIKTVMEALP